MKSPRLTRSGLWLAVLLAPAALVAQTTANDCNTQGSHDRRAGKLEAAIADFTKAIELDPQFAVAYSNRGGAKRANGDLEGAMADFNKAIELKPDFAGAYNNRGNVKRAKGDFDGAVADFTKANELDPKHVIGRINLASVKKQKSHKGTLQEQLKEEQEQNAASSEINNINRTLDANRPAFRGN